MLVIARGEAKTQCYYKPQSSHEWYILSPKNCTLRYDSDHDSYRFTWITLAKKSCFAS